VPDQVVLSAVQELLRLSHRG